MKMIIINLAIVVGLISLFVGIVSRLTFTPVTIPIVPGGLEAEAFLAFTNTCFLLAIIFMLMQILETKK